MAGQHRSNVKELTREIWNVLWKETDERHTISIKKLTAILLQRHGAGPDRATVASILDALREELNRL